MSRAGPDAELDHLAGMLGPWLAHLRHPAQFWPQFDLLARRILARATPAEREWVRARLRAMLRANRLALPRRARCDAPAKAEARAEPGPRPGRHPGPCRHVPR